MTHQELSTEQISDFLDLDKDLPLVYEELKRLAHNKLKFESDSLTLNTTDLVHEAYIALSKQNTQFQNKDHFFALASTSMRRILINYAKQKKAAKRGGDALKLTLSHGEVVSETTYDDTIKLDHAIDRYTQLSGRGAKIIEYWFFSGFKQNEIASMMDISVATVKREWQVAKAWLSKEIKSQAV